MDTKMRFNCPADKNELLHKKTNRSNDQIHQVTSENNLNNKRQSCFKIFFLHC